MSSPELPFADPFRVTGLLHLRVATVVAWLSLATAAGLGAQACPEGTISYVFVDNHSIFDTSEMEADVPFRWAYDLANGLHVETRASLIRSELLFGEGDCFDPLLLEESERILRNHDFIARADVFGVRQPDGSYHVVVDTQDEWTTKVSLGVAFEDGVRLEGLEVTEESVAGHGVLASAFFKERRERRDIGMALRTPRFLYTRTNAFLGVGRSRVGTFFDQGFIYPFVGEVGRFAGRQTYSRRESLFPYTVEDDGSDEPGISHVLLPFETESLEVTAAVRLGEPGNLTVFGLGALSETMAFEDYPGSVEVARGGDFSDTQPAESAEVDAVAHHVRPTTIFRLNFLLGQRNLRFIRRTGLDALTGVQDIRVGSEVSVTVGRALGDVGSGGRDAPDDLYVRLFGFGGWVPGDWVLAVSGNVEGRVVFPDGPAGTTVHDVLGESDLYGYWRPSGSRHTLFGRISGAGGWSVLRPFQLTLGGRSGVRGFREHSLPGARRILATVEDRFLIPWPAPDLLDVGGTFLADVGRIWSGDVPFGRTTSWHASVGAGIRIGFPAGSRGVLRADVAIPLTGDRSFSSPVFRVSLHEVLGLNQGFGDEELVRSRRPAVGTDLLSGDFR